MKSIGQSSICVAFFLALGCSAGNEAGQGEDSSGIPGDSESTSATSDTDVAATSLGNESATMLSVDLPMDVGAQGSGVDDGIVPADGTFVSESELDDFNESAAGLGEPPVLAAGACCPSGDCLCHGDPPLALNARRGPFLTATAGMAAGTAFYPVNAQPPFAGIAICPGFLNFGPEMIAWGQFYASWGIVTVVTNTFPTDFPDVRGAKLLNAVEELKRLNLNPLSPLSGKMSDRYGTSGYSMGGGGTTIASARNRTLKTSVGLAAWAPTGLGVQTPTLFFCGDIDIVAPCSGAQGAYLAIPNAVPKMIISIPLSDHLAWFGPNDTSGGWSLAFHKVYLEGDERWKPLLMRRPPFGSFASNIR